MFSREDIRSYIVRAYNCACMHGFHDKEPSISKYLMLVLTEVAEAVDADRRSRRAVLDGRPSFTDDAFDDWFATHVKDTVEDGLAGVCIRLFDLCGAFVCEPDDGLYDADAREQFDYLVGGLSFPERCYHLCSLMYIYYECMDELVSRVSASMLHFVFMMCEDMRIDIRLHIDMKMAYNLRRPVLNGKEY